MALELKQSLKMTQQLVMTPQLQQAIKLLQLSRIELVDLVRDEMMENPLLEESAGDDGPAEVASTIDDYQEPSRVENPSEGGDRGDGPDGSDGFDGPDGSDVAGERGEGGDTSSEASSGDDIDWDSYLENYQQLGSSAGPGVRRDDDLPGVEQTLTSSANLFEHLLWQLRLSSFNEEEEQAAVFIIGNLDDDGYFKLEDTEGDPLIQCAAATGVSLTVAERTLRKVQHLDPVGIAARDLQECLLIQARALEEEDTLVGDIIRHHMREVESHNLNAIAKAEQVRLDEVIEAVKIIVEMEPRPGRQYTGAPAQYITPDVYVHKVGDEYVTVLNDDGLSRLRVSGAYRQVLKQAATDGEARDYIQDKLRSAMWLIRSIHQRQRTIFKVTESIVKFQQDFFELGVGHLRPLILREVAEDIGMHESTVSRVTTAKYVHTPQGIYELKFFFNSAISRGHGDDLASEAVKSKIKKLVADEDVKKPLSDQKIVALLKEQDIEIARRTVAKYRDQLGILPSSKRKRLY